MPKYDYLFAMSKVLETVRRDAEAVVAALVEQVSCVPEVEYVFLLKEDAAFGIWTIINVLDRDVRRRIYAQEAILIGAFPDIPFDFHVAAKGNRSLEFVAPSGGALIFSRS